MTSTSTQGLTIGGGYTSYTIGSGIASLSASSPSTITVTGFGGAGTTNPCVVNIGAGYNPCWNTSTGFGGTTIWGEDFIDRVPDINRINDMCKQYPALDIAWTKFKTTYRLVKDDYDASKTSN